MRKRVWLGLFAGGAVVATLGAALFPYYLIGRFTDPPPSDSELAAKILAVINKNDDFPLGEFINDATDEVCSWVSKDRFDALVAAPGWQLTAHYDLRGERTYWFKKTAYWWWEREGLQVGLNSDDGTGCYAYVRRSDAI